jgi:hypothetical protein
MQWTYHVDEENVWEVEHHGEIGTVAVLDSENFEAEIHYGIAPDFGQYNLGIFPRLAEAKDAVERALSEQEEIN